MEPYEVKFGVDIWEEGVYARFVRYALAVEKLLASCGRCPRMLRTVAERADG